MNSPRFESPNRNNISTLQETIGSGFGPASTASDTRFANCRRQRDLSRKRELAALS